MTKIDINVIGFLITKEGHIDYSNTSMWDVASNNRGNSGTTCPLHDIETTEAFLSNIYGSQTDNDKHYVVIYYDNSCPDKEQMIKQLLVATQQYIGKSRLAKLISFGEEAGPLSEDIMQQFSEVNHLPECISRDKLETLIYRECDNIFNALKLQHQTKLDDRSSSDTEQHSDGVSASFLSSLLSSETCLIGGLALVVVSLVAAVAMSALWPLAPAAVGVALIGVSGFFGARDNTHQETDEYSVYQAIH